MKKLNTYSKNGHDFKLCARLDNIGLFHGKSKANKSETWEVIEIQHHHGREIAGKHCPPAEYPPCNEQWGTKGWTFPTEREAWEKFRTFINHHLISGCLE